LGLKNVNFFHAKDSDMAHFIESSINNM